MTNLADVFNNLVSPLVRQCQQAHVARAAMKIDLTELKAAADALSAKLATQIASIT